MRKLVIEMELKKAEFEDDALREVERLLEICVKELHDRREREGSIRTTHNIEINLLDLMGRAVGSIRSVDT